MSHHRSPVIRAVALSVLALSACDESTIPTGVREGPGLATVAEVSYSVVDLEIPDAGEGGASTSINGRGQVVGYSRRVDDLIRGFMWSGGVVTFLGTLGGRETRASDINDLGQVVGASENANGRMRAFRWVNGTMRGLGTLGGNVSRASAINNLGHIVGQSQLTGNPRDPQGNPIVHAFLLKNGVMSDLSTLGGSSSAALDINDDGQVAGWSQTSNGTRHPFLWQDGVMKDLLPPGSGGMAGTAYAITPFGVVVGERNNRAFRYSGGILATLPLGTTGPSVATGIRAGRIVGYLGGPGARRAFVLAGGQVTVLPLLPGGAAEENEAWAINDAGAIVGATTLFDSNVRPTMWAPQ